MGDGHHFTAGSLASGGWALEVTPEVAGWSYSGLRVLELDAGAHHVFDTGVEEMVVLPLAGGDCTVDCDGASFHLAGRRSVFAAVTDFVYVPRDARVHVRAATAVRLALPSARCENRLPPRHTAASDVPVELRGAGNCSRQVNNFCAADVFAADRLIAVEVLTPSGNWSSYPPHKHDEDVPGEEAVLEEIYYYEIAAREGAEGMGYQRVYGHDRAVIDVLAEVRTGDVVCMPHGWHGPSMAVPGYDMYYLNVMAGPSPERAWLIRDDPAHAWIRQTWQGQPVDQRLPLGGPQ
ncbi:MAG: 5-deoxy-glucuronate isomerase [Acidothermales bacterium]|nr:5-deoxy-glucuronate isomerase [Acidothermales bacterium]